MKVLNKTEYDTRYLRGLLIQCEKHEGTNYKLREVKVLKSKRGVHGRAWYNSWSINMYLPRDAKSRSIAQVYIHEVGHNLSLRHRDMTPIHQIDVSWLSDEVVPLKKSKPTKPKPNIVEAQAMHAQKKLDEWNKKLNRAKNYVKKYQRKVKYYEKKKAASPKVEKQGTLIPSALSSSSRRKAEERNFEENN